MRTLRLIKPWHLRTVRQRLAGDCEMEYGVHERLVPVSGPAGSIEDISSRYAAVPLREAMHFEHPQHPNNAPVSDVLFVRGTSIMPR